MKTCVALGLTLLCAFCGPLGCPGHGGLNPEDRGGVKATVASNADKEPSSEQESSAVVSKVTASKVAAGPSQRVVESSEPVKEVALSRVAAVQAEVSADQPKITLCSWGTVSSKDADSNTFTVRTGDGHESVFAFGDRTLFRFNGKNVTGANLQDGQRVAVHCSKESSGNLAYRVAIASQGRNPGWPEERGLLEAEVIEREAIAAKAGRAAKRGAAPPPPPLEP